MTFMRRIATAPARRPRTTINLLSVGAASARDAAAEAVAATAGAVTSAAIVMVAVFAIFATMQFADSKQLGVGIALPAAVALIGDRRPRTWRAARVTARGADAR